MLLIISAIAWGAELGSSLLTAVILIALIANTCLIVIEGQKIVVSRASISTLLIVGGVTFWFLVDAAELAFGTDPFESRYGAYAAFSAGIPLDVVGKTLFGVCLFQFCGLFGVRYIRIPARTISRLAYRSDRLKIAEMDIACLLVALLSYVPFAVSAGGDPAQMLLRLVQMRNSEAGEILGGETPGLWVHLILLGVFGGAISTARLVLGVPGVLAVRLAAIAISTFWVFLSGTRFLMIFLVLPSLILLTLKGGKGRTSSMKMKLFLICAVAAGALFSQAALRDTGIGGYVGYERASDIIRGGAVGHEHFEAMAIAVDLADRRGSFFMEFLPPIIAVHFVPRVWWPDKPDWESWSYYNDAVTGSSGSFNVTPSVTGQYYLNWGLFGVAYIGLLFGWLGRCADEWLVNTSLSSGIVSAVFCGFFYSFLFVSFRILSPIYIAYVIGAAIVVFLLSRRAARRSWGRE